MVVLSLTFLSMMARDLLVGDDLTWRHRLKHIFLDFHLEGVVVCSPIVDDTSVILPWSAKKNMAYGHGNNITLQCVFISSDLE
jgi:hypothetical protein